jgi:hypothetical protein
VPKGERRCRSHTSRGCEGVIRGPRADHPAPMTKITHVSWAMFGLLPPDQGQRPRRRQSVALRLHPRRATGVLHAAGYSPRRPGQHRRTEPCGLGSPLTRPRRSGQRRLRPSVEFRRHGIGFMHTGRRGPENCSTPVAFGSTCQRPSLHRAVVWTWHGCRALGIHDHMDHLSTVERSVGLRLVRLHELLYKKTSGRIGHRLPGIPPSLVLHTTGARTGKDRTNTQTHARDDEDYSSMTPTPITTGPTRADEETYPGRRTHACRPLSGSRTREHARRIGSAKSPPPRKRVALQGSRRE